MDQAALKAYGAAVSTAFEQQQILHVSYVNGREEISTRLLVPCSPFAVNTDGTVNFNAYSEIIETQGRDAGPGVYTFRLDRIVHLELDDRELPDGFWDGVLGNDNGGTVVFPGVKTPLFQGKFPKPTVTTMSLELYKSRGWTTKPKAGFVQKTVLPARRSQVAPQGTASSAPFRLL